MPDVKDVEGTVSLVPGDLDEHLVDAVRQLDGDTGIAVAVGDAAAEEIAVQVQNVDLHADHRRRPVVVAEVDVQRLAARVSRRRQQAENEAGERGEQAGANHCGGPPSEAADDA